MSNYALDGGEPASQMRGHSENKILSPEEEVMVPSLCSHGNLAVALLVASVVVGVTTGALVAQSPSATGASPQAEPITRTVLFRRELEGAPGKEVVVFVADLAPGAVGAKHYHPGPEFFYVLEGTLAHEPEGGPTHMIKMGAFGLNPNKGIHVIKNPSATERARAIDFLVAEKGQPITIPVK